MSHWADSATRWLDRHRDAVQLTLAAIGASALTATAIYGYQANRRRLRSNALKQQLLLQEEGENAQPMRPIQLTDFGTVAASHRHKEDYDESLIEEQLARNIAFLGEEGVKRVRGAFVVVVGAGSVGSWTALMLVRSGVQRVRVIDPKYLTRSTIAHHAVAGLSDIGMAKAKALEKHLREIAPFCKVEACVERLCPANMDTLLAGNPDFVVDTVDPIDDKLALAQFCHKRKLRLIAAMNGGTKADPTRIQISDISESFGDPLARAYRRRLKMLKIDRHIPIVYSIEKPVAADPVQEPIPDVRSRHLLPVLGPIHGMFGMAIATFIVLQLAKFTALPPPPVRVKDNLYNRIHYDVCERETKFYGNGYCPLDIHDVIYIYEEIWGAKSILSGPQDRLTLTRWDRSRPISYQNAVCMSRDEARAHDALPGNIDLRQHYGDEVVDFVNRQFEQEKLFEALWS